MFKLIKFNHRDLKINYYSEADLSVINEVFIEQEYKLGEDIIRSAVAPIIDIGAHIGMFAIYARMLNPAVPIYAYEPDLVNFQLMKENIKMNHCPKIIISNTGVWDVGGERDFYEQPDSHNHSFVLSSEKSRLVVCTTLEKIMAKQRIAQCGLLKIDAEGAEFPILLNLSSEIYTRINCLFLEYHEYRKEDDHRLLVQKLKNNNFKVQVFPSVYDRRMGIIISRTAKVCGTAKSYYLNTAQSPTRSPP
jgi:FkbM family methyltransferase